MPNIELKRTLPVATATFFLAEACNAQGAPIVTPTPETATPTPIVTESFMPSMSPVIETPTATIVFPSPTPELTPSPTLEPTPTQTPSPEPTASTEPTQEPIAIADLVNQIITEANQNGWKNVSDQKVIDGINEAYDNDPEAAAIINPDTNEPEKEWILTDPCITSEIGAQGCAQMFGDIYWKGYTIDQNQLWLDSLSKLVHYVNKSLDPQDFELFKNIASTRQNPF